MVLIKIASGVGVLGQSGHGYAQSPVLFVRLSMKSLFLYGMMPEPPASAGQMVSETASITAGDIKAITVIQNSWDTESGYA